MSSLSVKSNVYVRHNGVHQVFQSQGKSVFKARESKKVVIVFLIDHKVSFHSFSVRYQKGDFIWNHNFQSVFKFYLKFCVIAANNQQYLHWFLFLEGLNYCVVPTSKITPPETLLSVFDSCVTEPGGRFLQGRLSHTNVQVLPSCHPGENA